MIRFSAIIAILFLMACQSPKSSVPVPQTESLATININDLLVNTTYKTDQLEGIYTGQFDGSPISIAINYVSGKNISGYNVHKGLKRNIHGTLEPMGSSFKLMLDEPGDNRYDGHFDLFVDTASYTGQGTWTPRNDPALQKKTFTLSRKKTENTDELASTWSDTLNRILDLKPDGTALFSYYTNKGKPQEQMETINGNWQQKNDSILVFWQANMLFPSRHSSFYIVQFHDYSNNDTITYKKLRGEKSDWDNNEP